jgi:hypothetical protein
VGQFILHSAPACFDLLSAITADGEFALASHERFALLVVFVAMRHDDFQAAISI